MTTTYCTRTELESILGEAGVLALIDDNQTGTEGSSEDEFITDAIERAAVEMNMSLGRQYVLSELSANDWCKWCNAYLACFHLASRRNNPPAPIVIDNVQHYREDLLQIKYGRFEVPEQNPSFEHLPTVSNFEPELRKRYNPIRVVRDESTGAEPEGGRKRNVADVPGEL